MKILVLLVCLVGIALSAPSAQPHQQGVDGWHYLPFLNGSWIWMHDDQIVEYMKSVPETYYTPYKDMKFHLYTRYNPYTPQEIIIDDANSLRSSHFDPSRPTRFLTHGWTRDYKDLNVQDPVKAYIESGDFNVFAVDWSKGSQFEYIIAAGRVKETGENIAVFIEFLIREASASIKNIYVTGHSLGGHVAGNVGKHIKSGRLPVIVGLDPAGPFFYVGYVDKRIDSSDADYVEIIHTNRGELGFNGVLGHADFFPHGGASQPGCILDVFGYCSHDRAGSYFAESIRANGDDGFWGVKCETFKSIGSKGCTQVEGAPKVAMGGEPIGPKFGLYWTPVNSHSPYSLGINGV